MIALFERQAVISGLLHFGVPNPAVPFAGVRQFAEMMFVADGVLAGKGEAGRSMVVQRDFGVCRQDAGRRDALGAAAPVAEEQLHRARAAHVQPQTPGGKTEAGFIAAVLDLITPAGEYG